MALQIATQEATLRQIDEDTWGVDRSVVNGTRYLILPPGVPVEEGFTMNDRAYVKLER